LLLLLERCLMSLLQSLHLFLLLVTSVDRLPNGSAHRTPDVLTAMIMTQNVAGADTVWNQAFLVLALCDMLPQTFHPSTMWRDRTLIVLMGTFGSVAEQEETLLLMT